MPGYIVPVGVADGSFGECPRFRLVGNHGPLFFRWSRAMIRLAVDNSAGRPSPRRRALLAKVHMGVKALGMVDDDYRALLDRLTGERSAARCTDRQLDDVLVEFDRLGFTAMGQPPRPGATHSVAKKARALWISLHQLGAIEDASEAALEAFGRRQLRVDRLQRANQSQGFRLIEALKAMAGRHGWDQATPSQMASADRIRLLKDRLVGAQLARLAELGVAVDDPIAADRTGWSLKRLESAAQELAGRLREACG